MGSRAHWTRVSALCFADPCSTRSDEHYRRRQESRLQPFREGRCGSKFCDGTRNKRKGTSPALRVESRPPDQKHEKDHGALKRGIRDGKSRQSSNRRNESCAYKGTVEEQRENVVLRDRLRAPRAGAIAGIVFSILFIISLVLIRISVPATPGDAGTWLSHSVKSIRLALDLLPFAAIAFLWFIGVMRDRMGAKEDRFFATVFLGSGLLFLAMIFTYSAVLGGLIMAYAAIPGKLIDSGIYTFARTVAY